MIHIKCKYLINKSKTVLSLGEKKIGYFMEEITLDQVLARQIGVSKCQSGNLPYTAQACLFVCLTFNNTRHNTLNIPYEAVVHMNCFIPSKYLR